MNDKKLNKKDRLKMFLRTNLQQASFNYERIHALGFAYDMIPAIKKLYTTKEDRASALKRHLTFFNVTPGAVGPVVGVTAALEEGKSEGKDISNQTIQSFKVGLMGPLCGVGDPIFWGTLRPIIAGIGASMALDGMIAGPLIFFFVWNIIRMAALYYGIEFGYNKGSSLIENLKGNTLQKVTEVASIMGLFVIGALVQKWTKININLVVSEVTTNGKTVVTTVQDILNQIMPGLVPLLLTLSVAKLLKKNISPMLIIFLIFVVGILGYWIGFLGV
ncbi:PTS system mannose/fructose/sorbose family transporter subunit IID [Anaerococcus hydrogenalis]|uniref:PTS system mannose/fructose/sorbose family transporter subunit IID n=1 Tax=Anaerococcus hydrogenalis TaxID=33029 RepID=UPI0023EF5DE3|nr:PTS system mannose/fructose/sorbose family transporter subunit IID [Anaerococcus hydrogenalis]